MEFFLQIVLILACLFYGARKGGLALGLLGGFGIVVLSFAFKLPAGALARNATRDTTATDTGLAIIPIWLAIDAPAIGRSGRIPFLIATS